MVFPTDPAQVYRDFVTDGVPASGAYRPKKADIRRMHAERDTALNAGLSNGGLIYASKANLDADLARGTNSSAWVIGDGIAANNGIYRKTGASGSGSWTRVGDLPYSFIRASNVGAGTPDAIVATNSIPLPAADGGALVTVNVAAENTGPVSIAFNGGTALAVVTSAGNPLVAGYLKSGMLVTGVREGTNFRLLSDVTSAAIQAAAQAAQQAAEQAAARAEAAASSVEPTMYASIAAFQALPLVSAPTFMRTAGYALPADNGGALYRRRTALEGDGPGDVTKTLVDGATARYALEGAEIWLEALGVKPDGVTDNTAALAKVGGFTNFRGTFRCGPGVIKTNGPMVVPPHASFIGAGENKTIITAEGSTGTFPDNTVVYKAGGEPKLIPDLGANVPFAAVSLNFSAPHGRSAGDLILIYNPTDYSYSGWRTYYRAGEYSRVAGITSATELAISSNIMDDDGYVATNVKMYECSAYGTGAVRGFTAIAPGASKASVMAFAMRYCRGVFLGDLEAKGGADVSSSILHCYGIRGLGYSGIQTRLSTGGYGLSFASCQDVDIGGVTFVGWRHGVTMGAQNDYSIPNRLMRIHHGTSSNSIPDIAAADMHGNCEWCSYEDMTLSGGGFNVTGNHNLHRNIIHISDTGYLQYGREMKGWHHTVVNVRSRTNMLDGVRGIFDIGGNSDVATAFTTKGGTITLNNVEIDAPVFPRNAILIRNRGSLATWNIKATDVRYSGEASASNYGVISSSAVSGTECNRVDMANVRSDNPAVRKFTGNTTTKISGDRQSGKVSGTTPTTAATYDIPVVFPTNFIRPPNVNVSTHNSTTGVDKLGAAAINVTMSGFTFRFYRTDTGNIGNAIAVTGSWSAALDEV